MALVPAIRFQGNAVFVVISVLCFVKPLMARKKTLYEDDPCDLNGKPGVCKLLSNCPSVLEMVNTSEQQPEIICSYRANEQIVCCPNEHITLDPGPIAVKSQSEDQVDNAPIGDKVGCPVPPFEDKKMEGKQYLTWNKCVQYSQQMYTCERGSDPPIHTRNVSCHQNNLTPRIIDGEPADEKEFPHMALLGYTQGLLTSWLAGGTLISEFYVLTAAHVLDTPIYGTVDLVRLGVLDKRITSPDSMYRAVELFPHADYSVPEKCYGDIGLIRLDREVQFSEAIRPACLPSSLLDQYKSNVRTVTGWGVTEASNTYLSEVLNKVTLTEFPAKACLDHLICNKSEEWNSGKLICAGSHGTRKDSCQGDSGSPMQVIVPNLYCQYVVMGIVSTGHLCGFVGIPAVYTRVFTLHRLDCQYNVAE